MSRCFGIDGHADNLFHLLVTVYPLQDVRLISILFLSPITSDLEL